MPSGGRRISVRMNWARSVWGRSHLDSAAAVAGVGRVPCARTGAGVAWAAGSVVRGTEGCRTGDGPAGVLRGAARAICGSGGSGGRAAAVLGTARGGGEGRRTGPGRGLGSIATRGIDLATAPRGAPGGRTTCARACRRRASSFTLLIADATAPRPQMARKMMNGMSLTSRLESPDANDGYAIIAPNAPL